MHVREATTDDAEAVRSVHSESITELGPEGYAEPQVAAWARGCESADYSSVIENEETEFVVAEDEGTVVAFGSATLESPEEYEPAVEAEVTGVYVHPTVARTGVGSAVLSEIERRVRDRDTHALGLSASLNAVSFYEEHGYERVREYTHEFSSSESTSVTGTLVEMKKEL